MGDPEGGSGHLIYRVPLIEFVAMRTLLVMCFITALALTSRAEVREPTPREQEEIQDSIHKLVVAVNNRDAAQIQKWTAARFDAAYPGAFLVTRSRLIDLVKQPGKLEIATLARMVRMLSNDVAMADGFYRTMGLDNGDSAGRISITVIRAGDEGWRTAAVRFIPHTFHNPDFLRIEALRGKQPDGEWISLFDGRSIDGFATPGGAPVPATAWTVTTDGLLHALPGRGPGFTGIRTRETFASFELEFEWKMPPKGNSGVKYRLFYMSARDGAGHEYQLCDDAGDPGAAQHAVERSGALYNQIAPAKSVIKPVGEFNHSRIVVRGRQVEHWLNGEKVVSYTTESGPLEGPILLQHHTTAAWFRNIRIRRLTP